MSPQPRLVVFTMLFPHAGQPNAGVFIRERMFRVGQTLPLVVVACPGFLARLFSGNGALIFGRPLLLSRNSRALPFIIRGFYRSLASSNLWMVYSWPWAVL